MLHSSGYSTDPHNSILLALVYGIRTFVLDFKYKLLPLIDTLIHINIIFLVTCDLITSKATLLGTD